jgi:hypothetical protein
VKRLAVIGSLAAAGAFLVKKVRRGRDGSEEHAWSAPEPDAAAPPPPTPAPPSDADRADREAASRLDDESAYERRLDDEEQTRAAAAERLRGDPPQSDDG